MQLDVWAKEREVAGLKASLSTLTSEVQRLNKLCTEWKEAEESLKKKWKKIEEFDARRSELECIYTALLRASMVKFLCSVVFVIILCFRIFLVKGSSSSSIDLHIYKITNIGKIFTIFCVL